VLSAVTKSHQDCIDCYHRDSLVLAMEPTPKTSATHHELLNLEPGMRISSDRVLGLVLGAFFAVIAVLPVLRRGPVRWWGFVASLVCFAVALALPRILHPLNIVWVRSAILLHRIVSPIAMALLFFFGFAITGLVLRAFGKDLLRLKASPDQDSYWITRDPQGPARESMTHQF
jgi:hypothetical protein